MISIKNFFSRFYVDVKSRTNNYHLVHKEGCPFLPEKENRIYLGVNTSAYNALGEARGYFTSSECCRFCLKEEHVTKKELIFNEIGYADNFQVSTIISPAHEDVMHSYAS